MLSNHQLSELKMDDKTAQRYIERAIRTFHRVDRPVFLGPISMEIGLGIDRAQLIIDHMIENSIVREATLLEKASIGAQSSCAVYVLIGRAKPGLAHS